MKAIETRYVGPTETKPARIIAEDMDGFAVRISADDPNLTGMDIRVHERAARALADKMGWNGDLAGGGTKRGYAFVFIN